jgi:hypothetical protein
MALLSSDFSSEFFNHSGGEKMNGMQRVKEFGHKLTLFCGSGFVDKTELLA